MKKLLFTFATIIACNFMNAQEVKFGVKGGLNLGNLSGDFKDAIVDSDLKMRTSFHVGAFAEIKLAEKFAVQPEILYSIEGAKQDVNGESEKLIWDLQYLNIPIMAKYYATNKLSLEAGPQVGFLMKGEATFDGDTVLDFKDDSKSTAISLNLGAGYNFTDNIFGTLRYSIGMSNIIDEDSVDTKSNVLALSVGYKF